MSNAKLAVRPYRHSQTHRYYLDLRPFGKGRRFFRTRAEAESERLRQHTLHQRHGRAAVSLPQRELPDFMDAKKRLAEYDKTITNATEFYIYHLERVRRCKITVAELAAELLDAKHKDGLSEAQSCRSGTLVEKWFATFVRVVSAGRDQRCCYGRR